MRPRRTASSPRACASRTTRLTGAREVPARFESSSWVSGTTPSSEPELGQAPQHAPVGGHVVGLQQQLREPPDAQRQRAGQEVGDPGWRATQRVEVELVDRARLGLLERDDGRAARPDAVQQRDLAERLARPEQRRASPCRRAASDPHREAPAVHEVQRVGGVAVVEDHLAAANVRRRAIGQHPPRVLLRHPGENRPLHGGNLVRRAVRTPFEPATRSRRRRMAAMRATEFDGAHERWRARRSRGTWFDPRRLRLPPLGVSSCVTATVSWRLRALLGSGRSAAADVTCAASSRWPGDPSGRRSRSSGDAPRRRRVGQRMERETGAHVVEVLAHIFKGCGWSAGRRS